jgi:hypothetical protein
MVTRTTLISIAFLSTVGCKGKQEPAKQEAPAKPAPTAADDSWRATLPEVATGTSQLMIDQASGVVKIAADGTVSAGASTAATKPVALDGLAEALGLPPVAPRKESGFAAVEGNTPGLDNPTDVKFAKLGHPTLASGSPAPWKRLTTAFAIAHPNDVSGGVVVIADAGAPATALVDVLAKVGGFVAVRTGDKLGALQLAVDRAAPAAIQPDQRWAELRLDTPVTPAQLAALNTDALDVLVGPATKVQDLVKVIGELRAAKVDAIGFGRAPADGSPDAAARKDTGPRVTAWNFAIGGGGQLDGAPFRAAFDGQLEAMKQCYAKALAKLPKDKQAQTAQVTFALKEKITAVEVKGAEPAVTTCVTTGVRAAKFPPVGGQGAQAEVRISFAP